MSTLVRYAVVVGWPMASSPVVIVLTPTERTELGWWCRASAQCRQRLRARIVLAAAAGLSNQQIADRLGVSRETVRKWRRRYSDRRLAGLADLPRSGRPPRFTPVQIAEVKAIACTAPDDKGIPLARWSITEIASQAIRDHVVDAISRHTVGRWLAADVVKPWQRRSWISVRDPCFAQRAGVVLDLYDRHWQGEPLDANDFVISADEKPGIQALRGQRPAPALLPGRPGRVEFDYRRGGTLAYLAALDIASGHVMGITDPTTGITPFTRLVDHVMQTEPYASAGRVFWVVDNSASHRGAAAQLRLWQRYPNAIMVHTPVHASWLNQIEIYFSILTRKALHGASFNNLDNLAGRIQAFQNWYNTTSRPFNWTWTRPQLNDYLNRLAALKHPRFCAASFRVERMALCRRRLIPRSGSGPCGSCLSIERSIPRPRRPSRLLPVRKVSVRSRCAGG